MRLTLLLLFACSSAPSAPQPPKPAAPAFAVDATLEVASEEVSFTAHGHTIPGTLVHPIAQGPWPAVLILAGSGPTDRDWNNMLLPGTNGSATLLANELAKRGAVVLRFDKAGAGKNPAPTENWTLDTYREEGLAAIALLRARADVRGDRVFVAGHSEGGLHATRLAPVVQPPLAGVIYLSSASRTMAETILGQLEAQLRNPAAMLSDKAVEQELDGIRRAFAEFSAGKTVDPTQASRIPTLQSFLANMMQPIQAAVMRGLLAFDNAAEAAKLAGPFYVAAGGKDVQVDPELDGKHLERSLRAAGKDVTFHVSPDADHVLKHDPRPMPQIRHELAKTQVDYNADGRTLDDDLVQSLVAWLAIRAR
jgi:uncharacterized protein